MLVKPGLRFPRRISIEGTVAAIDAIAGQGEIASKIIDKRAYCILAFIGGGPTSPDHGRLAFAGRLA